MVTPGAVEEYIRRLVTNYSRGVTPLPRVPPPAPPFGWNREVTLSTPTEGYRAQGWTVSSTRKFSLGWGWGVWGAPCWGRDCPAGNARSHPALLIVSILLSGIAITIMIRRISYPHWCCSLRLDLWWAQSQCLTGWSEFNGGATGGAQWGGYRPTALTIPLVNTGRWRPVGDVIHIDIQVKSRYIRNKSISRSVYNILQPLNLRRPPST